MKVIVSAFILVLSSSQAMAQWWRTPPRQDPPSHQDPDRGRQDPDRGRQDPDRGRVGDRGPGGRWDRDWSRPRREHNDACESSLDERIIEMQRLSEQVEDLLWDLRQRAADEDRNDFGRRGNYFDGVERKLRELVEKTNALEALAQLTQNEDKRERDREREVWRREHEQRERSRREGEERSRREAAERAERERRAEEARAAQVRLEAIQLQVTKAHINKQALQTLFVENAAGQFTHIPGVRNILITRDPGLPQWEEGLRQFTNDVQQRYNGRPASFGYRHDHTKSAMTDFTEYKTRIHNAVRDAFMLDPREASLVSFVRWARNARFLIDGREYTLIGPSDFPGCGH